MVNFFKLCSINFALPNIGKLFKLVRKLAWCKCRTNELNVIKISSSPL